MNRKANFSEMSRRSFLESGTKLAASTQGVIYSRKYSEMPLENLAAGGKAIKKFTKGK